MSAVEPILQKTKIDSSFFLSNTMIYGNGIKNVKQVFGQQKRLILVKI